MKNHLLAPGHFDIAGCLQKQKQRMIRPSFILSHFQKEVDIYLYTGLTSINTFTLKTLPALQMKAPLGPPPSSFLLP